MTATLFPARLDSRFWCIAKDVDAEARNIFHRHYSYRPYRDGRQPKHFVGPGGKLVLITPERDALFIWRLFINDGGQAGINCAAFRNESPHTASAMILDAEPHAWAKWPRETRLYTYVDPSKIKSSNPGWCFIMAGWRPCGWSKKGLRILEKQR